MRLMLSLVAMVTIAGVALSGCSSSKQTAHRDPFAGKGSPYYSKPGPLPKGGGRYLVGDPYQVAGNWFKPREQPSYDKVGMASWYGPQFHRRMTSNGEWFDMNDMTAAHATLPLPSYARVTNLENGREIIVRINDRGPFVGTRIIDMSRKSAEMLAFKTKGMSKVRVQYLGPAPLNDNGTQLAALNRRLTDGGAETQFAATQPKPAHKVQIAGISQAPKRQNQTAFKMASAEEQLPAAKGNYFVQVGSFADPSNAERARNDVADTGPVQVVPLEGQSGTVYRVRVGPLEDESQARNALQSVVVAGHTDARLVVAQGMM